MSSDARAKTVHTVKVTLRRVKPPVWRRVVIPSEMRLDRVSDVLEAAMGWLGGHLHAFTAAGVDYVDDLDDVSESSAFRPAVSERKATLAVVLPNVGDRMRWDYDFGDGWEHDVVCEAIGARVPRVAYPAVIGGRRACPPEDCGGPYGYAQLIEALTDPTHEDHAHLNEWLGRPLEPDIFDLAAHDADVRIARPKFW
jgi:hypothetical protein